MVRPRPALETAPIAEHSQQESSALGKLAGSVLSAYAKVAGSVRSVLPSGAAAAAPSAASAVFTAEEDDENYILYFNDQEMLLLLPMLFDIQPDRGLDAQRFACHGCTAPIGIIFGEARFCEYTGKHFCVKCHVNETALIPARILHEWSFVPRKVAHKCKEFVDYIYNEPLIGLDAFSPQLYSLVEELKDIAQLRARTILAFEYFRTCRLADMAAFRKPLGNFQFLLDASRKFSLDAIVHLQSGALQAALWPALDLATRHVRDCVLCSQKGHYCELCFHTQAIFPFDLSTYRCSACSSVFHDRCYQKAQMCPKCRRVREREERRTSHSSESGPQEK